MPDEATRRTDLADLVSSRMKELDLSYRTLAARTVDPESPDEGPTWTRGTLENLAKGLKVKVPGPEKVRGLAAGLALPHRLVQDAMRAQFFDIDSVRVEGETLDEDTLVMLRHYETLSPEDRLKLRKIAEDWSQMRPPSVD
ncbi:XRE family transcriptional regulator [Streptomyces sp. NPDC006477]|uniref:XRE family transcriptional regulator n=1 Tax=Streptomyces sp. NPDC006477 TaxID=3364747 RepID=UPI0036BFA715